MDVIKPKNYIRLQKKLCNAKIIIMAERFGEGWGVTPEEACYRILCEFLINEYHKQKENPKS